VSTVDRYRRSRGALVAARCLVDTAIKFLAPSFVRTSIAWCEETIAKTHFGRTVLHRNFELKFDSLLDAGRGFAFPCDADGLVPIDECSEVLRTNYFYACALVGSELAWPVVAKSRASAPGGSSESTPVRTQRPPR
jgi:hypothetical protein